MNPTNHSETIVALQDQIQARKGLLACACEYTVALHSSGRAVYVGANSFGQQEITTPEGVSSLACASEYLLALMEDGTVFAAGSCAAGASLKDLTNVRVIHCSDTHWAALLRNNHVVIGTETGYTQGDSTEWPDVFDLVCGRGFTNTFPNFRNGRRSIAVVKLVQALACFLSVAFCFLYIKLKFLTLFFVYKTALFFFLIFAYNC